MEEVREGTGRERKRDREEVEREEARQGELGR